MRAPIGIRIRRRRVQAGLSQAQLARQLGISASYLNLIENNKRAIGGALLRRIGERLGIDMAVLSGDSEERAIAVMGEMLADPLLAGIEIEPAEVRALVARFPEAADAMVRLYRAYADGAEEIERLRHRLRSDPLLSEMMHELLNRIAAIRSGVEILTSIPDLTEEQHDRFLGTINSETQDLVPTVRSLVDYFDQNAARRKPVSTLAEVDDAIHARHNYFPALEDLAGTLGAELFGGMPPSETALAEALRRRFQIECRPSPGLPHDRAGEEDRVLRLPDGALPATRIFRMLGAYVNRAAGQELDRTMATLDVASGEARRLVRRALSSYVAGAILMPYDAFHAAAEARRYDIELIAAAFGVSFEQAAHRLVTLRRPGREGVPFGFLRADRSGRLTKRFPLPGLTIPGFGHGCLLWPIYEAFASGTIARQLALFPGGGRFLLIARAVPKQVAGYRQVPLTFSIMLACDVVHADRVVYGDGLDFSQSFVEVGPTCASCPRTGCAHRQTIPD